MRSQAGRWLGFLLIIEMLGGGAATARAQSAGNTGLPACDRYLQFYRCFIQSLPRASRQTAQQAYQRLLTTWRQSVQRAVRAGGSTLRHLRRACQTGLQSMTKAISRTPYGRQCLKAARTASRRPPARPPRSAAAGAGVRRVPHRTG